MRLIILGAPGAGKGTQASIISQKLDIPHISTGEIFRDNIKSNNELGKLAKEYIDKGQLVPDDITIRIVKRRLDEDDCRRGFILDGFPRTVPQADALESELCKVNQSINKVLDIDVNDDEIVDRMMGRRVCTNCGATYHVKYKPPINPGKCDVCSQSLEQRDDDTEETLRKRLQVYHRQTEPLIEYYRDKGLLTVVRGEEDVKHTTEKVLRAMGVEQKDG